MPRNPFLRVRGVWEEVNLLAASATASGAGSTSVAAPTATTVSAASATDAAAAAACIAATWCASGALHPGPPPPEVTTRRRTARTLKTATAAGVSSLANDRRTDADGFTARAATPVTPFHARRISRALRTRR